MCTFLSVSGARMYWCKTVIFMILCAHFCLSQELVCIDVKQWFVWFYVHISVCLRISYVLNIKQRRRKTSCADYYASVWIVFEEPSVFSLLEGNNWIWIVFEELGVCSLLESNNWIWIVFEEPSVVRFLRVTIGFKDQCGICSR